MDMNTQTSQGWDFLYKMCLIASVINMWDLYEEDDCLEPMDLLGNKFIHMVHVQVRGASCMVYLVLNSSLCSNVLSIRTWYLVVQHIQYVVGIYLTELKMPDDSILT